MLDALGKSLKEVQEWRLGDPETVSWLVECSDLNQRALLWIAGDLELRHQATAEQIAELREAARNFKKYLHDDAPAAAVPAADIPAPAPMPEKAPPRPLVPLTVTVALVMRRTPSSSEMTPAT